MNLDVTADDSCLDPHVSCVKASHPATQLDVNPEQRSVRKSMMSGPHHGDSAHTHTTFGTSGKFIRASLSTGQAWLTAIRHRPSRSAPARLPASRDDPAPTPNAAYRATRSIPSPLPVLMGLRWGEAAALRVADIDFLRRRIALHGMRSLSAGTLTLALSRVAAAVRWRDRRSWSTSSQRHVPARIATN
jgi:hypothetical protein